MAAKKPALVLLVHSHVAPSVRAPQSTETHWRFEPGKAVLCVRAQNRAVDAVRKFGGRESTVPWQVDRLRRAIEEGAPECAGRVILLEATCEDDSGKDDEDKVAEMVAMVKASLAIHPSVRTVFFATSRVALDASVKLGKLKEFKGSVRFHVHDRPGSCMLYGARSTTDEDGNEVFPEFMDHMLQTHELTLGVTWPVQKTIEQKIKPWLESKPVHVRKGTRKLDDMFRPAP